MNEWMKLHKNRRNTQNKKNFKNLKEFEARPISVWGCLFGLFSHFEWKNVRQIELREKNWNYLIFHVTSFATV